MKLEVFQNMVLMATKPLTTFSISISICKSLLLFSYKYTPTLSNQHPTTHFKKKFIHIHILYMSLRARPVTATSSSDDEEEVDVADSRKPPPPTLSQWAVSQTLASTAQLANLLPTGTLLALQAVTPIFTNHGSCDAVTRPLTAILLIFLTAVCFLASFTDSFKSSDGQVFYGFATFKGMWVFDSQAAEASASGLPDLRKYKLTAVDWIHAFVSAFVLGTLAMRDRNVVSCFYPRPSHEAQEVLDIVPLGLGLVCSLVFVIFPSKRHGIGYPVSH